MTKSRSRTAGFSLLEVLAAVAFLGLWFSVIVGSAMQAMRGEERAERRMVAGLLADERMADIEIGLATGAVPEIGTEEEDENEDGIRLEIETRELELDPKAFRPDAAEEDDHFNPEASDINLNTVLAPSTAQSDPPLLSIEVRAYWTSGVHEEYATRTTYAFNTEAVSDLIEGLEPEGEDADSGDHDGDHPESDPIGDDS